MPGIKKYQITEPWLDLHCELGEGPHLDRSRHWLRFVDIRGKKLHQVDLAKGPSSLRTFELDNWITVTADIEGNDNEFVYSDNFGYGIIHKDTGKLRPLKEYWIEKERE